MIRRGWIVDAGPGLVEIQMAKFFCVTSAEDIPHIAHAAKKSDYSDTTPAQLAWLYRVCRIASGMVVATYSEKKLRSALADLGRLLSAPEEIRHVPRILSECGVRYVVVESLPNAEIDGVTTWDGAGKPIIGMSLKRDRVDNFWFVLRHEIEHVLEKHGQSKAVIDANLDATATDGVSEQEAAANAAASDFCIPTKEIDSYIARKAPYFSEKDLLGMAYKLRVHPGLVAGQLRRKTERWDLFTRYLVKIRHFVLSTATFDGWGQVAPVSD
jgi:HTH-type transcriptional regulator/antitoxin HigA